MYRVPFLAALVAFLFSALPAAAQTFDDTINRIFADYTGWYVGFIFAPIPGTSFSWIAMWLVIGALIFTFYFGFIQLKGFQLASSSRQSSSQR